MSRTSCTPQSPASGALSDALTIETLVHGLEDLHRGPEIQLLLIAMGQRAIEPLARFLLGPPDLHPEPRMLAAEALGAIGGPWAVRALAGVARGAHRPPLALAFALSQDAVRSCAARELGRLNDPSAIEPLLEGLCRFHLVEAGRGLLGFHESRAISPLVDCLNDSFVRERAAAVLFEFGREAVNALAAALDERRARDGIETPRSLECRIACARLLGELEDRRAEPVLWKSLSDPAREIRTAAAVGLARVAPDGWIQHRIPPLIEGLGDPLWSDECADALLVTSSAALPVLVDAIRAEARRGPTSGASLPSRALRSMLRTLARMGEPGAGELRALTRHPSPPVRGLSLAHLCRIEGEKAALLVAAGLDDPDPRVRRTAAAWRIGYTDAVRGAAACAGWRPA